MLIAILLLAFLVWLFFHKADKIEDDGFTCWAYRNKANTWGIVFRKKRKVKDG